MSPVQSRDNQCIVDDEWKEMGQTLEILERHLERVSVVEDVDTDHEVRRADVVFFQERVQLIRSLEMDVSLRLSDRMSRYSRQKEGHRRS